MWKRYFEELLNEKSENKEIGEKEEISIILKRIQGNFLEGDGGRRYE